VALDKDGNPKVRKPRTTKKAEPIVAAEKPKSPVIASVNKPKSPTAKPAKTRKVALDADGNPKVRKPRKTKKTSPNAATDKPKVPKPRKPRKQSH